MRGQEQEQEQEDTWDWVRVWKIVLFSTTTRFCDIKQTRNCLYVAFLYDDDNKVSHPLVRSLVRSGSRFFNDFIIGVKSYMFKRNSRRHLALISTYCLHAPVHGCGHQYNDGTRA